MNVRGTFGIFNFFLIFCVIALLVYRCFLSLYSHEATSLNHKWLIRREGDTAGMGYGRKGIRQKGNKTGRGYGWKGDMAGEGG